MKRTERHHLKGNPVAETLATLQTTLRTRNRAVAATVGVVVTAIVISVSIFGWQRWRIVQASDLLAEAMSIVDAEVVSPDTEPTTPEDVEDASPPVFVQPLGTYPSVAAKLESALPYLLAVAEGYPALQSGVAARYQAAVALTILGRPSDANDEYEKVITLAGDLIYGRMARLGLAEAHLQVGAYADAIGLLEQEAVAVDSGVPVDAVLMRLGHAYRLADQPNDALVAFTRVVEEFPSSVYSPDARSEIDSLRIVGSGSAASGP